MYVLGSASIWYVWTIHLELNLLTYLIKTINFNAEIQAFDRTLSYNSKSILFTKIDKLAAKILWQLCAAMMSWVGCLQRDSELFILFAENSQILLKISVIPILLTFIYQVALDLLLSNQLNSLQHIIVTFDIQSQLFRYVKNHRNLSVFFSYWRIWVVYGAHFLLLTFFDSTD